LLKLPEKIDFIQGASFGLTFLTLAHAGRPRAAERGETVLTWAQGRLGTAGIQVARYLGAM